MCGKHILSFSDPLKFLFYNFCIQLQICSALVNESLHLNALLYSVTQ